MQHELAGTELGRVYLAERHVHPGPCLGNRAYRVRHLLSCLRSAADLPIPPPPPPPPPPPVSTAPPGDTDECMSTGTFSSQCDTPAVLEVMRLNNALRASEGKNPLICDDNLSAEAQRYSIDLCRYVAPRISSADRVDPAESCARNRIAPAHAQGQRLCMRDSPHVDAAHFSTLQLCRLEPGARVDASLHAHCGMPSLLHACHWHHLAAIHVQAAHLRHLDYRRPHSHSMRRVHRASLRCS